MACDVKHWLMPNIIIVCQHNVSLGERTERRNQKMFLNRRRSTDLWTLGKIVLNCLLLTRKRLIDYASFFYRSSFFITFPSEWLGSREKLKLVPNIRSSTEWTGRNEELFKSHKFQRICFKRILFGKINRQPVVASNFGIPKKFSGNSFRSGLRDYRKWRRFQRFYYRKAESATLCVFGWFCGSKLQVWLDSFISLESVGIVALFC